MLNDIENAIKLLNELHRERLSYDEYDLLLSCIQDLKTEKEALEVRLMTIREAVYGKN